MRGVFLRAVLLGVLAALALVVARCVWAETTVFVCTSATEPSPLRIERDTARKTVLVGDVARSTKDLYPLNDASAAWTDALLAQLRLDKNYQCRRAS
jgi:hypothetical protein